MTAAIYDPTERDHHGNPYWCEQCGEWPQRYRYDEAGLCVGCAYDDPETRAEIPAADLVVIQEAVSRCQDSDDAHSEYLRGVAELAGPLLGLPGDLLDSFRGWLCEPHAS